MSELINVAQAARQLGVSARQVRNLVGAGALPARRLSSGWLLSDADVRARAQLAPPAGRPVSAVMAWAILNVAQHLLDEASRPPGSEQNVVGWLEALGDRSARHRLRRLMSSPLEPQRWEHLLARRADRRRVWLHPGVLERFAADRRLRPGGGFAAAVHGAGISAGPARRFYLDSDDADAVLADYRLQDDPEGPIDLMVVPAEVPEHLRLAIGGPVPLAVALVDLLDSPDARERHIAELALAPLTLGGEG